jgi:5'-methylthioadenosine phosphorylase
LSNQVIIGVIGGTGLYRIEGLTQAREVEVETPWGRPSDALIEGGINGVPFIFLPRHGRHHSFSPTEVPYRANIWALKKLGATDIISVSAVGSLREDIAPGEIVLPDQFIDRTLARPRTFFSDGIAAHVGFAEPISRRVGASLEQALVRLGLRHHRGGTYVCIEGPQFSTRAESFLFRTFPGAAVIGMTNMPEARLAREAELPYATVALVTDWDCWREGHDAVSVEQVMALLQANAEQARALIRAVADEPPSGPCPSQDALRHAVLTPPGALPAATRERLALFLARYWQSEGRT